MSWEDSKNFINSEHGDSKNYSISKMTSSDDNLPKGIKAIYSQRIDGKGWETKNYIFAKSEGWDLKKAKKWFKQENKTINKGIMNFLVRDLVKSGELPALIVKNPYGRMVREGVVKLIVKTREYKKYTGMPVAIAEEDGKIYAMVTLNNAFKLNKRQFEVIIDKHNITEDEVNKWGKENKEWRNDTLWGYPFKIIKEFKIPIEFYIPPDTKDWVDGVNVVNMKVEDIDIKNLEKSSNGELQDIHEKMHSLWGLIKKIDVTEKRIETANMIVEKHSLIKEYFDFRSIEHKQFDSLDKIRNEDSEVEKIIKQEDSKWVLYSKDGAEVLGKHDTKEQALAQERSININKSKTFDKYIPICKINEEKQIVYGEVLVPDTFDAQGHKMNSEEIEKASHHYMTHSQKNKVMHKGDSIQSSVVESWIVPQDIEYINPQGKKVVVTKGTWMMGTKIHDQEVWKQVKERKLTGYSIGALGYLNEVEE